MQARVEALEKSKAPAELETLVAKPRAEDFPEFDAYLDARDRWNRQQWGGEEKVKQEKAKQMQEQQAWQQKLAEAHTTHPDLQDLIEDLQARDVPLTTALHETLMGSDVGGEVLYYLATHPEDVRRISTLPILVVAKEIGKIEALLTTKPAPANKQTKAPTPIEPIAGRGLAPMGDLVYKHLHY